MHLLSLTCRDSSLKDDAIAEYAVALAAKGTERKKLESSLKGILGASTTADFCDWCEGQLGWWGEVGSC